MKKFLVAFLLMSSLAIIGCEGDDGQTGASGIMGPSGMGGIEGQTGATGTTGESGATGSDGREGLDAMKAEAGVPDGYYSSLDSDGHIRWCADGYHLLDLSGDGMWELCYALGDHAYDSDAGDAIFYQHEYVPSFIEVVSD